MSKPVSYFDGQSDLQLNMKQAYNTKHRFPKKNTVWGKQPNERLYWSERRKNSLYTNFGQFPCRLKSEAAKEVRRGSLGIENYVGGYQLCSNFTATFLNMCRFLF